MSFSSFSTLSAMSARSRQTSSKLSAISVSTRPVSPPAYPNSPRPSFRCLISTGENAIAVLRSMQPAEHGDQDPVEHHERDHAHHGRQIERTERWQEASEQTQVRITDVVQEALDAVEPGRVREPDPRRHDVGEDQEDVDVDERVDEGLRLRDRVQRKTGVDDAHRAEFGLHSRVPTPG